MSPAVRASFEGVQVRLRARRPEIEQAMLARVHAVADPGEVDDPNYGVGLREAVRSALDYAIAEIEASEAGHGPIPDRLLAQARAAARNGVSPDTVLRRYAAGYSLLSHFVIQEAEAGGLHGAELQRLFRSVSATFDRLVAAVTLAYNGEADSRFETAERRQREWVKRLLAGEPISSGELHYELDAWHLGVLASGPGAVEALRDLAAALDRSLLFVREDETSVWAWLGGRSRLAAREALRLGERSLPAEVLLALGEPGEGVDGWRLSHRQAKAAMVVARRGFDRRVGYADVALLASALSDEVLTSSLREIYLAPLENERDGGAALRRTLAAYFAAGQNTSSAAAALGVSRKTVSIHLRTAGEKIGRPIDGCAAELETALRLREQAEGFGQ